MGISTICWTRTRGCASSASSRTCRSITATTSFYYVDPNGNSVELQYDNFDDWNKSSEWMRTSREFASNPIGVPVDTSKMIVASNGGASRDGLHRRAFAGEFSPSEPLGSRMPLD
jgi:hypothetical protein